MRVLVCGCRNLSGYIGFKNYIYESMSIFHTQTKITKLIEGGASGVDYVAKQWAIVNKIPIKEFPAEWDKYNKSAGSIRNQQMIDEGKPDIVIAFWDGKSRDTLDMISRAISNRINVSIVSLNFLEKQDDSAFVDFLDL